MSKCCGGNELDGTFPRTLDCKDNTKVTCRAYDCSAYFKSEEECEYIDETTAEKACCIRNNCFKKGKDYHPIFVECYNIDPEKDCKEVKISHTYHAYCGIVAQWRKIPFYRGFNT